MMRFISNYFIHSLKKNQANGRMNNTEEVQRSSKKNESSGADEGIILPKSEQEARQFEKQFVHTIYNEIADHFSHTRHSPWPGVARFIDSMAKYSTLLDIGCGNGKYLNLRNDILAFGCDYSDQLVRICQQRNFNCFVSDCMHVSVRDNCFDYAISIAVLHHMSTEERRLKALEEIKRILKPGGRALVTVWAKEQKYKNKESFYISAQQKKTSSSAANTTEENEEDQKKNNESKRSRKLKEKQRKEQLEHNKATAVATEEEIDPKIDSKLVHKFGKEFERKDVFVTWHYNPKAMTKNEKEDDETKKKVYLRFYHVFENSELESLIKNVPGIDLIESYYEEGNWCAIIEKKSNL